MCSRREPRRRLNACPKHLQTLRRIYRTKKTNKKVVLRTIKGTACHRLIDCQIKSNGYFFRMPAKWEVQQLTRPLNSSIIKMKSTAIRIINLTAKINPRIFRVFISSVKYSPISVKGGGRIIFQNKTIANICFLLFSQIADFLTTSTNGQKMEMQRPESQRVTPPPPPTPKKSKQSEPFDSWSAKDLLLWR